MHEISRSAVVQGIEDSNVVVCVYAWDKSVERKYDPSFVRCVCVKRREGAEILGERKRWKCGVSEVGNEIMNRAKSDRIYLMCMHECKREWGGLWGVHDVVIMAKNVRSIIN